VNAAPTAATNTANAPYTKNFVWLARLRLPKENGSHHVVGAADAHDSRRRVGAARCKERRSRRRVDDRITRADDGPAGGENHAGVGRRARRRDERRVEASPQNERAECDAGLHEGIRGDLIVADVGAQHAQPARVRRRARIERASDSAKRREVRPSRHGDAVGSRRGKDAA
jgi:hypothetical protein